MGIELKRNLSGVHTLQPGEFHSDPGKHTPRTMITVTLSCPMCGGLAQLDEKHTIDPAGRVVPSFACRTCPLLEFITLDGWRDPP